MSDDADDRSPRGRTAGIRALDATCAGALVAAFARPVVAATEGRAGDAADPVTRAAGGAVTLDRPADGPATVVGYYKTHLYLDGLVHLPLSVARQLIRHRGHLYLDRIASLGESVAAELGKHPAGGLSLAGVRELSPRAARALGRHEGELSLNGLRTLDPAVAAGLASHANELSLGGIATLSPLAAAALSRHRGDLNLNGLVRLSGRAATHLARHRGKLHLHGLSWLTDGAAAAFGRRTGLLCLKNLRQLPLPQALHLAGHVGPLHLYSLPEIDDSVAACLGRHQGALALKVADDIPLARLVLLVRHRGQLLLQGLRRLDERRAAVLADQPCRDGGVGLSGLFLGDVREVVPAVAAIMAMHRAGELSLSGLRSLSADVARELVRHPLLGLDGVTILDDRVARILAGFAGASLSLGSLEHVGDAALAALRANPAVHLPRRLQERPAA